MTRGGGVAAHLFFLDAAFFDGPSLLGIELFEIGDGHCSNQYYEGWFNERASCFRLNTSAFALLPSSPSSFDSVRRCWFR
jgi:hypothetical protein